MRHTPMIMHIDAGPCPTWTLPGLLLMRSLHDITRMEWRCTQQQTAQVQRYKLHANCCLVTPETLLLLQLQVQPVSGREWPQRPAFALTQASRDDKGGAATGACPLVHNTDRAQLQQQIHPQILQAHPLHTSTVSPPPTSAQALSTETAQLTHKQASNGRTTHKQSHLPLPCAHTHVPQQHDTQHSTPDYARAVRQRITVQKLLLHPGTNR